MLRVALTGGIATGKSYVLGQLRQHGVPCLDADALARDATAPGTELARAIAERFGRGVIAADGAVARHELGSLVFADEQARRDLEALVHPVVYRAIAAGLRTLELAGDTPLAVVDVPLLYESGHEADFDRVIVTACPVETQITRLVERGLSEREARRRIEAQLSTADKTARADFVIQTDGSLADTDRRVREILENLKVGG